MRQLWEIVESIARICAFPCNFVRTCIILYGVYLFVSACFDLLLRICKFSSKFRQTNSPKVLKISFLDHHSLSQAPRVYLPSVCAYQCSVVSLVEGIRRRYPFFAQLCCKQAVGGRPPRYAPPLSPSGRRSASRRRADDNVAAVSHGQHVPTPAAAAAWRANTAMSKAAWWPWPLTFWPWKWCPSHVWRGLPLPILVFLWPICSRLRPDVRDIRQTYRRQTDIRQHHRFMPPPIGGGGIIMQWLLPSLSNPLHVWLGMDQSSCDDVILAGWHLHALPIYNISINRQPLCRIAWSALPALRYRYVWNRRGTGNGNIRGRLMREERWAPKDTSAVDGSRIYTSITDPPAEKRHRHNFVIRRLCGRV